MSRSVSKDPRNNMDEVDTLRPEDVLKVFSRHLRPSDEDVDEACEVSTGQSAEELGAPSCKT